jgi:hypothetical protein
MAARKKSSIKKSETAKYMSSSGWLILAMVFVMAITGCRTAKTVTGELRPLRARELLKKAAENDFTYTTLSARTKIDFTNAEGSTSFRADLRMKHDSAIWLSIKPALGLEVARVLITADTVKILDRLNKQYIRQPFSYLQQMFDIPVSFELLQQMITGELLVSNPRDVDAGVDGAFYTLEYQVDSMQHRLWLNPDQFTIAQLLIRDLAMPRMVEVHLKDYQQVDNQWFAMDRNMKATAEEIFTMQMVFSRVRLNEDLTFTFQAGSNYEAVD